jgi:hypothetical protein
MRRHVRHQRHIGDVGCPLVLDPADGLVRTDVNVGRVTGEIPGIACRDIRKLLVLRRRRHIHRAVFARLLDRFFRPFSRVHIVGHRPTAQQVHRHDRVLGNRAPLQEQDLVVGRNGEQGAQIGFHLVRDGNEFLAAMAHLHDRHARTVPVGEFIAGLFENSHGQRGRSRGEIQYAHEHPFRVIFTIRERAILATRPRRG